MQKYTSAEVTTGILRKQICRNVCGSDDNLHKFRLWNCTYFFLIFKKIYNDYIEGETVSIGVYILYIHKWPHRLAMIL